MDWPEVLEALDARIAAHEEALASGTEAPEPYVFPSDLGPLPDAHRQRAEALLERYMTLQAQVSEARAKIGSALARGGGSAMSSSPSAPAPAFVDGQA
ncbi:MAG: hypothetical protein ACYCUF_13125 [Acidimicrobiales bacterium]|nr:hypothetical protein [Actinomycetota bacterium]